MQNENKNSGNKSLFLYTALIFAAAIILIVVAFFGQRNVINSQVNLPSATPDPVGDGITQKAALISEQNAILTKQNEALNTLNTELSNDKKELEQKNSELEINYTNGNIFCTVYQYIYDNNFDDAQEAFSTINPDSLTDAQKIIYSNIKKILN
ncbi:MAG: hypothetical protein Q4G33_13785 [bacterium]|nr:hypothetical protein [bacterium]